MRGTSTHGGGARKKRKKSGHHGGGGMAGSGKRADHKKTLVTKLYGHGYFGKQGITSKGTKKDKRKRMNLEYIENHLENFVEKGIAKKTPKGYEIKLEKFKILGGSEKFVLKSQLVIFAKEASKSAIENVKKAGGDIILKNSEIVK